MKKLGNTEAELKKNVAYKKSVYINKVRESTDFSVPHSKGYSELRQISNLERFVKITNGF